LIDAYRAGIPDNGKPFPDGSKMAKVHWIPKKNENAPGPPTVPGGGTMSVQTSLEQGSTFILHLPLAKRAGPRNDRQGVSARRGLSVGRALGA
jgi:hypothetical protein